MNVLFESTKVVHTFFKMAQYFINDKELFFCGTFYFLNVNSSVLKCEVLYAIIIGLSFNSRLFGPCFILLQLVIKVMGSAKIVDINNFLEIFRQFENM